MKIFAVLLAGAALFAGVSAVAQTSPQPAVKTGTQNTASAPVPGKTSFTAGEAKARMEKRGYHVTGDPVKDNDGIWYAAGTADNGKSARLMLDYEGNVFETATPPTPVEGGTRLTASQAKSQMQKRGYNITSNPVKDDKGIWYAEATKNNEQTVQVMVDYQGNVFESGEFTGHPSSAPGIMPTLKNPIKQAPPPAAN